MERGKNKILGGISVFKGSVKCDGPMDETKNRYPITDILRILQESHRNWQQVWSSESNEIKKSISTEKSILKRKF